MPKDAKYIEIDPKVFAHDVSIVGFAAATDDSRPLFTGIYVTYSEGKLILAATDGFRLSEKALQVQGEANEFSAIIPAKTLVEVAKLFAAYTEPIKMVPWSLSVTEQHGTLLLRNDVFEKQTLVNN